MQCDVEWAIDSVCLAEMTDIVECKLSQVLMAGELNICRRMVGLERRPNSSKSTRRRGGEGEGTWVQKSSAFLRLSPKIGNILVP